MFCVFYNTSIGNVHYIKKINFKNEAKIGIFGLGYVGLPLAIRFLIKNFKVFGFDINKEKLTY